MTNSAPSSPPSSPPVAKRKLSLQEEEHEAFKNRCVRNKDLPIADRKELQVLFSFDLMRFVCVDFLETM